MKSPIREEDSYVFIIIVNIRDFKIQWHNGNKNVA